MAWVQGEINLSWWIINPVTVDYEERGSCYIEFVQMLFDDKVFFSWNTKLNQID